MTQTSDRAGHTGRATAPEGPGEPAPPAAPGPWADDGHERVDPGREPGYDTGHDHVDTGHDHVDERRGPGGTVRLSLLLNGTRRSASAVPPEASLLTALREHFGLAGSKNACEQGECGSCTVYLDGEPVCSCLVAAGQAQDREVRTVEGLADTDPHGGPAPGLVQRAFVACGAVQCGFCTPGLIVAVDDLVRRGTGLGDAEVREALAGNLCRCTGYEKILEAVTCAAAELRARREEATP